MGLKSNNPIRHLIDKLLSFNNSLLICLCHLQGPKSRASPGTSRKSKKCWKMRGRKKSPFSSEFLDVFFDVDSDKKKIFEFGQSGAKIWPF